MKVCSPKQSNYRQKLVFCDQLIDEGRVNRGEESEERTNTII
jgi:hypothetical protein